MLLLALLGMAGPLGAEEAQPPPAPPPLLFLFRDDKALRVGDVVTVLVTQTAIATEQSQTQSQRSLQINAQGGTGVLGFIPSAGLSQEGSLGLRAQGRKSLSVIATIACRVVEVAPSGLLRVEGSQEFLLDRRKQTLFLSGWVRPQDIGPNNTVLSTQMAEARLEFRGDWRSPASRGLLGRIVDGFQRFLRLLF